MKLDLPRAAVFWACVLTASISCGAPGDHLHTFTNPEPSSNDYFGQTIALIGGVIAIGAPFDSEGGMFAGSVYLFDGDRESAAFGSLLKTIHNPTPQANDLFGRGLAGVGKLLAVGAYHDGAAAHYAGSVYLYDADPMSSEFGTLLLTISDPAAGVDNQFGYALAGIGDGQLLIGSPNDSPVRIHGGSAYLYDADPSSPSFGARLLRIYDADQAAVDNFGYSVAATGQNLFVGAYKADGSNSGCGRAYLFSGLARGVSTQPVQTFDSPACQPNSHFGWSIAASNERVVIGVPHLPFLGDTTAGGIAWYDSADGTWKSYPENSAVVVPENLNAKDAQLGKSVAVRGHFVLAGRPFNSTATGSLNAAFLYDVGTHQGASSPLITFRLPVPATSLFGETVAFVGNDVLVTAILDDTGAQDTGAVYMFEGPTPESGVRDWMDYP